MDPLSKCNHPECQLRAEFVLLMRDLKDPKDRQGVGHLCEAHTEEIRNDPHWDVEAFDRIDYNYRPRSYHEDAVR